MSNARMTNSTRDTTRTAQAKRETIARREARALKTGGYAPRAFDLVRIAAELETN